MTLTQRERRCIVAGYRIARAQAARQREEMASEFFATLKARITAEMVSLYQRGCELRDSGASEEWEEDGGGRAKYLRIAKNGRRTK